ncbi:MAG: Glu-tRNA(Gln) amidotransferase subunit GatD [Candidatus Altiarchaeota archaeon]
MDKEVKPGAYVRVESEEGSHEGIVMERSFLADADNIILKLDSGYNIGIEKSKIIKIQNLQKKLSENEAEHVPPKKTTSNLLPQVSILATGGTIASRVDYITGGVVSATSAQELIAAVPELGSVAQLSAIQVFNKFSENLTPADWITIAKSAYDELKKQKPKGIVITHGTDTMGYTSAALSFLLKTPVPVVLTGAQRSSDRGSSDAALNLIGATRFAGTADFSGVTVAMHGTPDDTSVTIHPGTRVKKLHSSRRDAFKTVGDKPIAKVRGEKIEFLKKEDKKSTIQLSLDEKLEQNVTLLKYAPGLNPKIIDQLVSNGVKGIVIEGTGLGHTSDSFIKPLSDAISSGVLVIMTSQTIWGRVNMNVYSTGRNLLEAGVIPGEDMLSETAYVKLMWVLAKEKKPEQVRKLMLTNVAGEITEKSLIEKEDENK